MLSPTSMENSEMFHMTWKQGELYKKHHWLYEIHFWTFHTQHDFFKWAFKVAYAKSLLNFCWDYLFRWFWAFSLWLAVHCSIDCITKICENIINGRTYIWFPCKQVLERRNNKISNLCMIFRSISCIVDKPRTENKSSGSFWPFKILRVDC